LKSSNSSELIFRKYCSPFSSNTTSGSTSWYITSDNILLGLQVIKAADKREYCKSLLPESLQKDFRLFPSKELLLNYEMMEDLGDFNLVFDKAWTEIKASN
jgi:hypothetical protein